MKTVEKKTKGHWPKGKRRSADVVQWSRVLLSLNSVFEEHYEIGVCTPRAFAAAIGVDSRSVRRWLNGEDRPSEENQRVAKAWVTERIKAAKRKR